MTVTRLLPMSLAGLLLASSAWAGTYNVSTSAELTNALSSVQADPNSEIILAPGIYPGSFGAAGVTNLTVRSSDPSNPSVIDASGFNEGFLFNSPDGLILRDLEVRNASFNGINIDDGGDFSTPGQNLIIRNVTVRDIGGTGNHDGIKLSGIVGFYIERARIIGWGTDGGGIDIVGSHDGLIENSLLDNSARGNTMGSGIRPKGGSSNIIVRANRLVEANARPLQAGGLTGDQFFRPPLTSLTPPYVEAEGIIGEGNVIVGGEAGVSWVNTLDGTFRNNVLHHQDNWALRILNEHGGDPDFAYTANGQFLDNVVFFTDSAGTIVNIGPDTVPASFTFDGNQWYNSDTPANSTPTLPAPETNGVYGIEPDVDIDDIVMWQFGWGHWLVNANDAENSVTLGSIAGLYTAVPDGGTLDLSLANPFVGPWTFTQLADPTIDMEPLSQAFVTLIPEPGTVTMLLAVVLATILGRHKPRRRNDLTA